MPPLMRELRVVDLPALPKMVTMERARPPPLPLPMGEQGDLEEP